MNCKVKVNRIARGYNVEIMDSEKKSTVCVINENHIQHISAERAAELIKDAIEKELAWTLKTESKKF